MFANRFTFFAQIANFLILAWLLRRFLFRPILKAANEREARLEATRKEAEAALAAAEAGKKAMDEKQAAFDAERRNLIRKAEDEARDLRQRLSEAARADVDTERAKWRQSLEEGWQADVATWSAAIRRQAFALAETVLREVAGTDLEDACIRVFLRKLEALPAGERAAFVSIPGSAVPGTGREIRVQTGMPMKQEAHHALAAEIHRLLGTDAPVRFENDAVLGLGIELSVGGRTFAWTIANALADLEAGASIEAEAFRGSG